MRKIFFSFVLILGAIGFSLLNVNAATNPYNKNFNGGINCTWFAWQQAYDKAGVALPGWGNANTWYSSAKKAGYETGKTPRVNSIVVWKWNNLGHVGYVERVYGDYIYVWDSVNPDGCPAEMPDLYHCWDEHTLEEVDNGACAGVSTAPHGCAYSKTYWHQEGDLIGYIYLDNAPKKPSNQNATNQNSTNKTPSNNNAGTTNTQVKKSNNANIKDIKISAIDFAFKKDTLEYNLEVENNIESINIEATLEHSKAKIEGTGEQKLNIGENKIELVVTAEDGTKQTYTLKIKRKDNNAYLTNLEISTIAFKFDKETLEYELNVARDIEKITIKGVAESTLATIEGLGDYELKENQNTIKIVVTAEDKTNKTYTITIKREPITEESKDTKRNKSNIWLIVGVSLAVFFVVILLIIIRKRKRVKNEKNI